MVATVSPPRRLRLSADGLTAAGIVRAIAEAAVREVRLGAAIDRAEVVVDVTNAWSIPWTTQAVEIETERGLRQPAYLRHVRFRQREDRTEAVYELAA